MDNFALGKRIRKRRVEQGMTQEQLAQQVVAWSSALSMVTIFCFAAGLRAMGVM